MDEVVTQDVELETLDEKEREAFWDARVQEYFDGLKTKELRLEAPPILAPTDDFTATIISGGGSYSLKSISQGQGHAGPEYRMLDLQTNRPVRLTDFITAGSKIRYQGTFYIDRYADLVDLSNPTVLYPNPNHSWDGSDNTHVGGTGQGGTGNGARWRSNIWSNHFLYMNLYEAGRTGSSITDVQRLKYNWRTKHRKNGGAGISSRCELYCIIQTGSSVRRLRWESGATPDGFSGTGYDDTAGSSRWGNAVDNGSLVPYGYNTTWYGGSMGGYPGDAAMWAEIKEHIALGMLGGFVQTTGTVDGYSSWLTRVSVDLDFTIQY